MSVLAETALAVALAVEGDHDGVGFVLVHMRRYMFQTQVSSAGLDYRGGGVVVVRVRVSRHQTLPALDLVLGKLAPYSRMHLDVDIP